MLKSSLRIFLLIICFINVGFAQTKLNIENKPYLEKIRLNVGDKTFKDTVVLLRNYIDGFDDKRIICNDVIVNNEIDKKIYESKYIQVYLKYQERLKWFSIVSYKNYNNVIIASYYSCNKENKETVEMVRFKVVKCKIEGINMSPNSQNDFVSPEEYDGDKIRFPVWGKYYNNP